MVETDAGISRYAASVSAIEGKREVRELMEFLSYLITGISLGSIYAIIALGYTMVYGIAKMLNFAHGDVIMVGGYVAFYATSFDALTVVASTYSYKELPSDAEPDRKVKLFWAVLLMLFPIALIFSDSSMANLQTVSIIAAFPIGIIIILILFSFFRDAKVYLEEREKEQH